HALQGRRPGRGALRARHSLLATHLGPDGTAAALAPAAALLAAGAELELRHRADDLCRGIAPGAAPREGRHLARARSPGRAHHAARPPARADRDANDPGPWHRGAAGLSAQDHIYAAPCPVAPG